MALKVGLYIAFVFAYIFYCWISHILFRQISNSDRHLFWTGYSFAWIQYISFFGFVWLLTLFFDLSLTVVFLLVFHAAIAVASIFWLLSGNAGVPWAACSKFSGFEFALRYRFFAMGLMVLCAIAVVVYPVFNAFLLFRYPLPSDPLTINIFRAAVLFFFWGSAVVTIPVAMYMLISENLDEATRTRILISQLSTIVQSALFLSLTLWAFGVVHTRYLIEFGPVSLSISPLFIFLLILFFMFCYFLPYIAGWRRAKHWRRQLASRRQRLMDDVVRALNFPDQARAAAELRQVQERSLEEFRSFLSREPGVQLGLHYEESPSIDEMPPAEQPIYRVYKLARPYDPRFDQVDFLRKLHGEIGDIVTELESLPTLTAATEQAKAYAAVYRKDATADTDAEEGRPLLIAATGVVLTGLASPLFGEASKWIWSQLLDALKGSAAG